MKTKGIGFVKDHSNELLASFILSFTLFLIAPILVCIYNSKAVSFNLRDIWIIYILTTLFFFLSSFTILLLLKRIFFHTAVVLFALSVCFFIEGNWFNYNLGELDGHEIIWSSYTLSMCLDLAFWGALVGISIIFRRFLYYRLKIIFLFLILYQASIAGMGLLSNPILFNNQGKYLSRKNEFEFSKSTNVILLILDTFRSEAFEQILNRYPDYRYAFRDFVFYSDAVGGYPTTRPSIPLALTGQYYDNSISVDGYLNTTTKATISAVLKENGFSIENYGIVPYYASLYENYSSDIPLSERTSLSLQQYSITGIRYAPLFLKRYFVELYYEGQDYYHQDMIDFHNQVNTSFIAEKKPTFKIFHLSGAHAPFQFDNNLTRGEYGYIEQTAASLHLASDMIAELKIIGGYDNSLILIIGDHGSQQPWEYTGSFLGYSAQPLMLAKRINQTSREIQYSDSKVSISDIPKTITSELGIQASFSGYSIFDHIPADRPRKWFYYSWEHSYWNEDYLPTMYEFEIIGPANRRESYTLRRVISEGNKIDATSFYMQLDRNILENILSDDVYRKLLSTNFSYEFGGSQYYSWASGPEACIYIPTYPIENDLTLSVEATPYTANGKINNQSMNVTIDQTRIDTHVHDGIIEAFIPFDLARTISTDGQIGLCFAFPDATKSPEDYGLGPDRRLLGYRFTSIIFTEEK